MRGLHHFSAWWSHADQAKAADLVRQLCTAAPLQRPHTPSGRPMRVRVTSGGRAAWWGDQHGYRYLETQPSGEPLPRAPEWIMREAVRVCTQAGVPFAPDSVLVNWYDEAAFLSTHRDESEDDLESPIVSFSLGAPATFELRGETRESPVLERRVLESGDALVMAQPCRNWFHAIARVHRADAFWNPLRGPGRISILVRKVRADEAGGDA